MKYRIFLAISVPAAIHPQIVELQQRLGKLALPVVWEAPEKIHLTLNFLGTVRDNQIANVIGNLDKTISGFSPFTLNPMFLETLYKRHEPTLIYLSPTGQIDVLKELQKAVSTTLNGIEFPQPERFMPHITIGKLKRTDPVITKRITDMISDVEFSGLDEFQVDKLTLFNSMVTKAGSTYDRVCDFTLT